MFKFSKMHGLGNHFVVVDLRDQSVDLTPELVRAIGDGARGVGFDQLVTIENDDTADAYLAFWNSDGSKAGACGNATRCCADRLMNELGVDDLSLRTTRGILQAVRAGNDVSINMGYPQLEWDQVPLSHDADLNALPIDGAPAAVGMGNPHCVFFVDDVRDVDLAVRGAEIEHHPLFPERTNVEFVELIAPDHLRMRVWERGGMITEACGSGACAVAVAAHRRGLTERKVTVTLDGGDLQLDWRNDGVWMTGGVSYVFDGVFDELFLGAIS